ncbi:hypothetical protein C0J52_20383 [Blattella germanica]|nr:hypothetical protein C0J52_20383 [Blattella germanica]
MSQPVNEQDLLWMVRPCDLYKEEYSDCTSIKARFHQYFIHGESVDCSQWKRDYDNCVRWENNKNSKALNNVWTKRDGPPPDWNKPLPEKFQKEYENTYLYHRAKEMAEGEGSRSELENRTLCVIS